MKWRIKFDEAIKNNNSLLCIGLDPDSEKIPKHLLGNSDPIFSFNKAIIDSTHNIACVFKPNIAFYEALGITGLHSLKRTIEYIRQAYPGLPIIMDAKRADIANTASLYAKSAFEYWDVDAITVFPNLGLDSLLPFLSYKEKMTIILIKTSNPDAPMFQNLIVDNEPYYLRMAKTIRTWTHENIGIFVGATYPKELEEIRNVFPNHFFLSAGMGAQSAEIELAVKAGVDKNRAGIMFNASRSILYAGEGEDFAEKAREAAIILRDTINKYR